MDYLDSIYGVVEINEPVLLDLMQSQAMQRLRGVLQHGITALIGITQPVTRFDHSVGVMLLVRRLHAYAERNAMKSKHARDSPAEQIAALLHDVSHTAFSHVIDYVVDGHDSQSYHEEWKEAHLAASDVPEVLARHGYDWRDFLHEDDYALLEQPAPRLCADRLDYFLRDSRDLGLSTLDQVHQALDHLVVHDGRIGVDAVEVARWLAYTFIAADKASWANFREVGLYEVTARSIKTAMQIGAITENDFWGTDDQMWRKLHAIDNAEVQQQLCLVSPATRFEWDEVNPTFRVSTKLRTIDPDVLIADSFQPLSALDNDFARYRSEYLSSNSGKWPMRVVLPLS
jgi:HD superfamily phosphohydrolase